MAALLCALAAHPAQGADAVDDPMAAELSRFVRAYRVAEATSLQVRMQIAAQARKPGADRAFLQCLDARLRPAMYDDVARVVATETFHDLERLRTVNAFFESSAGRRLTDTAIRWLADSESRAESGLAPLPMPEPALTASERATVQAWSRSAAHADFQRFVDPGLRTLGSNPLATAALKNLGDSCRAQGAAQP